MAASQGVPCQRRGSIVTEEESSATERTAGKKRAPRATHSIKSLDYIRPSYPHDIHPALVPGISVDEQRRRYSVDKIVFSVAGLLTVAFVIWGLVNPASVGEVAGVAYNWVTNNLSWLFSGVATIV